ncbi:putative AMP-dependent synthetase/ligase, ANL domain-containing protein [Helianthus annuus]|nr:putative AMP-dependent synthetase/ligase, ANL domain-containing protein [Helianthus annuus]
MSFYPQSPTTSITDFLFRNLHTHSNSPALIDPYTHKTITFFQLKQHITQLAHVLHHSFNISKYDVVLIFSPNSLLFPVAFLAVTSIGAIVTTANPLYTVTELSHQISDSKPKLIITVDQLKPKVNGFNLPVLDLNTISDLIEKADKTTSISDLNTISDLCLKKTSLTESHIQFSTHLTKRRC